MKQKKTNTKEVGKLAQSMINGDENYLFGAEKLIALRDDLGIYANDPDFVAFIAVVLELENLRMNVPGFKTDENIQSDSKKVKDAIIWAKEISLTHCESLAKRYYQ